jgi:CO/xanthine dehydrogenase Mo-binding subunit
MVVGVEHRLDSSPALVVVPRMAARNSSQVRSGVPAQFPVQRSVYAHARLVSVDIGPARGALGVVAVLTGADLKHALRKRVKRLRYTLEFVANQDSRPARRFLRHLVDFAGCARRTSLRQGGRL